MRARVEYACDFMSENMNDQHGHIIVTPQDGSGGHLHGTWLCKGGKGKGAVLDENTTLWDNDEAELILDSADLCQGIGTYDCDIDWDENGYPAVANVVWIHE